MADVKRLGEPTIRCKPEEVKQLETLHLAIRLPGKREKVSTAYRLRLLYLGRWTIAILTRYRTWYGLDGETLDGTNNCSEHALDDGSRSGMAPYAATNDPSQP